MKASLPAVPTNIVIFGATGDLSQRKLMSALFDLYIKRYLSNFNIIGISRREESNAEFRSFVRNIITRKGYTYKQEKLNSFLSKVLYCPGLFEDPHTYERVAEVLISIDDKLGKCSNKLFYLAVPPALYEKILQNLADSGLSIPCSGEEGWTRILVEKPFGRDIKTAQKLDHLLGLLFKEEQIFRIDHYLAKETIQNILAFRFSNTLFEPIWSKEYIDRVEISMMENLGVEGRGSFYDDVGALRDVGQNHILQMLALIAMENPQKLSAPSIRDRRAELLLSLHAPTPEDVVHNTLRAQYVGFRDEEGVAPDSVTETYFKITAFIDNDRWQNIPFILKSGKKLAQTKTEIKVYFKQPKICLCPPSAGRHIHQNVLIFRIQPDEGISVIFWAKRPGFEMVLDPQNLSFSYKDSVQMNTLPDAYERVLFDCIRGDQTLFASTKEVEAEWKFITPILEQWRKNNKPELLYYYPGEEKFFKTLGKE